VLPKPAWYRRPDLYVHTTPLVCDRYGRMPLGHDLLQPSAQSFDPIAASVLLPFLFPCAVDDERRTVGVHKRPPPVSLAGTLFLGYFYELLLSRRADPTVDKPR